MSEHGRLLRSTSTISSLTILSRIFGYIREQRIAFLLGTLDSADAYYTAYLIPNLLRRLVGEGAVSAAFIPTFTAYLAGEKKKEAFEFVNALLSVLTAFLALATVLGIVFSPQIVAFVAEGYTDTPEKLRTTVMLNRIMFPYLTFVSLAALVMGVLNSFHRFAASAFAPVMLNLSIIGFSFLAGFFSEPEIALATGVVIGGVLQLLVQIPSLLKTGFRFRFVWNLSHAGVRRVGKLMVPLLFGVGIVQINVYVGARFATHMGRGAMASINFADRVMELVLGGYAIALSTAILPLLSRQAADRRLEEMRTTLNFAIRAILFVTLPAAAGLILLRTQIVHVLFEYGEFDRASTLLTARPLLYFALGLSAFSLMKIIVPAFYALHDTRTPVWIAFGSMLLNIGLNFLFFEPLQNGGPPLATSIAAAASAVALFVVFGKRHGSLRMSDVAKSCVKFAAAVAVMGAVAYGTINIPGFYAGGAAQRIAALTAAIAASVAAYFGTAYALEARELGEMGSVFSRRQSR